MTPKGKEQAQEPSETQNTSCSICFQARTGRGITLVCSDDNRKKNRSEIVIIEGGAGAEQIVSKVVKDIVKEKGLESSEDLRLKQLKGGNDLPVTVVKRKIVNNGMVDADLAAKIKKGLDIMKNETSTLLHILRKGKVQVESNIKEALQEVGLTLQDEYESLKMEFEESVKIESDNKSKKSNKKN